MIKRIIILILILLVFWLTTYAEKVAVLPELMKPVTLGVDDTQLYVTEGASVFIYSLADYRLITKFGREGEGPQEFRVIPQLPLSIDVNTDKIIINSLGKISYFTKKGEFIREVKASSLAFFLQPLGDCFLGGSVAQQDKVRYKTVNLYDAKLNKIREVYRVKDNFQGPGNGTKILTKPYSFQAYDDKILLPGEDDATVEVFDKEMNKMFSLHLDQERIKVDQKFKDTVIERLKTQPATKDFFEQLKPIIFPDYFPAIALFFVDDGMIYLMTWKIEKNTGEFFTYDMSGAFIKRVLIPIQYETELQPYPITINKGKLYQIVENEEEVWEFHMSKIN